MQKTSGDDAPPLPVGNAKELNCRAITREGVHRSLAECHALLGRSPPAVEQRSAGRNDCDEAKHIQRDQHFSDNWPTATQLTETNHRGFLRRTLDAFRTLKSDRCGCHTCATNWTIAPLATHTRSIVWVSITGRHWLSHRNPTPNNLKRLTKGLIVP